MPAPIFLAVNFFALWIFLSTCGINFPDIPDFRRRIASFVDFYTDALAIVDVDTGTTF